jgi:oxygen-independent coproporphyrinogen-3 oxidase
MTSLREDLRQQLATCAYPGYVYGYPHKKAYRPLEPVWTREEAWRDEDRRNLYAYVHLPFCNQRCSFCNLFTYVPGSEEPTGRYLDALARDMENYAQVLGRFSFARLYLGGGTPTFLTADELARLFRDLREIMGIDPGRTQGCVEASPETMDPERLAVLRESGIQRISLGVQSFVPEELRAVNRRFDFALHERAIEMIGAAGFPEFNLDLIYGLPGQTHASWFRSLNTALSTPATSLFLYPLYIRPLTGLDRRADRSPTPSPLEMHAWYDETVVRLREAGFNQRSMRQFHRGQGGRGGIPRHSQGGRGGLPRHSPEPLTDDYRCQRDGMVGLGAGARSYTRRLHYSTPWKMTTRNIRSVVEDYCAAMAAGDFTIRHGFVLDDDERFRRWVIQSLFAGGFDVSECEEQFGPARLLALRDVFALLQEEDCVVLRPGRRQLTPRGLRHSDVVAGLFFSPRVRQRMAEYEYDA